MLRALLEEGLMLTQPFFIGELRNRALLSNVDYFVSIDLE